MSRLNSPLVSFFSSSKHPASMTSHSSSTNSVTAYYRGVTTNLSTGIHSLGHFGFSF